MARWNAAVLALCGLLGAAGVGLAAASAHLRGGELVILAASFLLFHAGGGAALTAHGPAAGSRGVALLVAASLLVAGAILFSTDVALRGLAGTPFLWGTAPIGGSLMILGWLTLAAAAFLRAA